MYGCIQHAPRHCGTCPECQGVAAARLKRQNDEATRIGREYMMRTPRPHQFTTPLVQMVRS